MLECGDSITRVQSSVITCHGSKEKLGQPLRKWNTLQMHLDLFIAYQNGYDWDMAG